MKDRLNRTTKSTDYLCLFSFFNCFHIYTDNWHQKVFIFQAIFWILIVRVTDRTRLNYWVIIIPIGVTLVIIRIWEILSLLKCIYHDWTLFQLCNYSEFSQNKLVFVKHRIGSCELTIIVTQPISKSPIVYIRTQVLQISADGTFSTECGMFPNFPFYAL